MGTQTYPSKKSPVNPEQHTGQTGPGLKTNATGHVTKTYPNKKGGGFKLSNTSRNGPGTFTAAKKGAKQSRPGTDVNAQVNPVPGDISKPKVDMNLRTMPKAQ